MARIRYIKPEFFGDTTLADISPLARLFYIGLFCQLDRQGLTPEDPKLLKREIFPYDDCVTVKNVAEFLDELEQIGRIKRFEHNHRRFIYCPSFVRHQKFHIQEKAKYQIPLEVVEALEQQGASTVPVPINTSARSTGNGERGTGNGQQERATGTISDGELGAEAPSLPEPVKPKSLPGKSRTTDPELALKARSFIAAYVRAYQSRFPDGRPEDLNDGKTQGQIMNWIRGYPIDRACQLIQVYFQMDTRWFGTKGYDFLTFRNNLNKIGQALDSGKDPDGNQINWSGIKLG